MTTTTAKQATCTCVLCGYSILSVNDLDQVYNAKTGRGVCPECAQECREQGVSPRSVACDPDKYGF